MLLEKRIPFKYLLGKIKRELGIIIITGLAAHFLAALFSSKLPVMPGNIPAFLGTAITVLLSFKMSQSYERWWEARKVWGAIVNDSRSFLVQLQSFLPNTSHPMIKTLAYRQIGWCYALGQALRGQNPLEGLEPYLSAQELQQLAAHQNKPLGIIQLNALDIKGLYQAQELDTFKHVQLDATLVRLCDAMGRAERINSTVFPKTYRMFLHFSIYLFVVMLSISLQEIPLIFEMPLLIILSSVFFLLEKAAFHLQDPFRNRPNDTPVTAIARTIEINLRQLLGEPQVPGPVEPQGFYLL
ncbi:bestrophin family protein [Rufibacter psychrotolerans]|uniref:bestrophin family protein n=1 Tax=Rufibacter psychrotolerans TaxID=2812556 RepID=UPI00196788D1|nr:bestrophin family ion channel [Rufibacter sp. SYSU D00308]